MSMTFAIVCVGSSRRLILSLAAVALLIAAVAAIAAVGIDGAKTAEAGGDHGGEAYITAESIRSTEIIFSIDYHSGEWWVNSPHHTNKNLNGCIKAEPGNQTAVITGLPANTSGLSFEVFFEGLDGLCASANRLLTTTILHLTNNPYLFVTSAPTIGVIQSAL